MIKIKKVQNDFASFEDYKAYYEFEKLINGEPNREQFREFLDGIDNEDDFMSLLA
jgi:hypothetical protein